MAVQYAEAEGIPYTAQVEPPQTGMFAAPSHKEVRYGHYKNFAKSILKAFGTGDVKMIPKCMSRLLRQVYQSDTYTDHKTTEEREAARSG